MLRPASGAFALLVCLAACTDLTPPAMPVAGGPPMPPPPPPASMPVTPPPGPVRVAVLLPLSGGNAVLASAMLRAVQLALGAPGSPTLDLQDTGGDPQRAAAAAQSAVAQGDAVILGPLTAAETQAVAPVAQAAHIPVLAFTSDPAAAQPGVWTLGITPGEQMRRLIEAVREDGRQRIGAVLPANPFGDAYAAALQAAMSDAGMGAPRLRQYAPGMAGLTEALKSVSDYAARHPGHVPAGTGGSPASAAAPPAAGAPSMPAHALPVDALLVGEIGTGLDQLADLLPFYDLAPPGVRVLGPALWASGAGHSGKLAGAWYAAPDASARASYVAAYAQHYAGAAPPSLSDIAFDAAAISRVLAADHDFSAAALTRPQGFAGVDGLMALLPDGHVHRALAVYELQADGTAKLVKPASAELAPPGA